MRVLVLLALAACSFPEKRFVGGGDGGPKDGQTDDMMQTGDMMVTGDMTVDMAVNPNYPCSGVPLPTTAAANVMVSGHVQDTLSTNAPGNAPVEYLNAANGVIGNASTNANGDYTRILSTGGTPLAVHVRVTPTNFLPARAWPARPVTSDLILNIQLIDAQTTMSALASGAGVTYDPTKDVLFVVPRDCNESPAPPGALVTSAPAGDTRYIDSTGQLSATLTATSSFGAAIIFNVPPGTVTVNTRAADGTQFRTVTITAVGGAGWSVVYIQP